MDTPTRDRSAPQAASTNDASTAKSQKNAERRALFVLILLGSAQFMVALDFSIVNVALPAIQRDLGFTMQNLQWIVSAYSLTQGGQVGWGSAQTLLLLVVALVLLVTFVSIEARIKVPLIRLGIFRLRTLTGANVISFLAQGAFAAMVFIVTLYMQQVLDYTPITTGIAFLPMAMVFIVVSNGVSWFVPRFAVLGAFTAIFVLRQNDQKAGQ